MTELFDAVLASARKRYESAAENVKMAETAEVFREAIVDWIKSHFVARSELAMATR